LADVVGTIRFNNSQENTLFYQYQREVRKRYQPLLAFRQQAAINNDKDPRWQVRFQEFNQTIKNYVDSLYRQYPQSLTTRFLKSYQEPRKPILPVKQLSAKDSAYIRSYVREHFFENSSLADERMIYTPTIPARLERWMKSISKLPKEDLIKLYARAIDQTQGTVELRKHFIGQIAQSLELTPDPNLDEVYTFIIKNYVEKDPSLWDASTLQKIKEVYEIKQKLAIGNVFPELALTDMAENPRPLSSVSAENTLLFFYDPGCSHCRDSAPKLVEYLQKNPTKLTVYAVSLDPDEGQWKTFIKEMKTDNFINVHDKTRQTEFYKLGVFTYPTLYLLDRDKKIVKRWLNTEQLEQILP
jgi:thiol-disulfide isomerase/thioredoxin